MQDRELAQTRQRVNALLNLAALPAEELREIEHAALNGTRPCDVEGRIKRCQQHL